LPTHDPLKLLGNLRDHIARHDKPIAFLFGAGTSCAVNAAPPPPPGDKPGFLSLIPCVIGLTEKCKSAILGMGEPFKSGVGLLEADCKGTTNIAPNIEDILSRVRHKRDAIGAGEKLAGMSRDEFIILEMKIRETIVALVNPDIKSYPKHLPHEDFAYWIRHATRERPIEIFTTNYDLLIERTLEDAHIPVFDGFVGCFEPFFLADSVERDELLPGVGWVRLWKIHGSINWNLKVTTTGTKVLRTEATPSGQVILPSHLKYDESRKQPYLTFLSRLGRVLEQEDSLLVTCGYSFSDQHINAALFSVLETRARSHIIALHHGDLDQTSQLFGFGRRMHNLMIIARDGAMIGTKWGAWSLAGAPDGDTAAFLNLAFDCEPGAAAKASPQTGAMRLGDFNCFCKFLLELAGIPEEA
jgi:hypothetical protein